MIDQNRVTPLLSSQNLQEVSVEELEEIVHQYPYFPVGQFLLAKKLKQEKSEGFLTQAQKTAVYFTNPLWLQYQLLQEDIIYKTEIEAEAPESITEIFLQEEIEVAIEDETDITEITVQEPIAEIPTEKEQLREDKVAEDTVEVMLPEEITETTVENEVPVEEVTLTEVKRAAILAEAEIVVTEVIIPEQATETTVENMEVDDDELPADDRGEPFSDMEPVQKLADVLREQVEEFKKPVAETAKLPFETEPYHTIDYFASQGIKLSQETQDKLAIKVRRFTDWLKQMKSINPLPADLGTDPEMEHKVKNNAAFSNELKEVATEAMAEVLIKQGKIDQAIQLYIKLSFLNPRKSAYFATQIENLKGL